MDISGFPIVTNELVPEGQIWVTNDNGTVVIIVHPDDLQTVKNEVNRHPWWTRNMLGVKEAERDRRKYPRRRTARRA